MTLDEAIRQIGLNERIRIRRTPRGIYVIRDIYDFYPKTSHQYLAPSGEWQACDATSLSDLKGVEPWVGADG